MEIYLLYTKKKNYTEFDLHEKSKVKANISRLMFSELLNTFVAEYLKSMTPKTVI